MAHDSLIGLKLVILLCGTVLCVSCAVWGL